MHRKSVYLIRIWDSYASSKGDWENEAIALTHEDAKKEQARLAARGHKTNVSSMRLVESEEQ